MQAPSALIDAQADFSVMQQVKASCTALRARLPKGGSARDPSGTAQGAPEREEQHRVPGTGSINDESQFETTGRTPVLALLVHDPSFREILRCLPLRAPSC